MATYSHSRLETFENCRHKYRLQYIDRIKRDFEGIEAFLGNRVHEVLEKLYKDLLHGKLNSLQDLLIYYHKRWDEAWSDDVKIVNSEYSKENYIHVGKKSIEKYYEHYKPFDQAQTIGIEKSIYTKVGSNGKYSLQGYIDRLAKAKDGTYEIHDYKTSQSLPPQAKMDKDRQLALYQIAVQEKFPDAKNIRLIWHYLVFDSEMESKRNEDELEELKDNIANLISTIEATENFEPNESELCNWCPYWDLCPAKKHLFDTEQEQEPKFKGLGGKELADRYVELKSKIKELDKAYKDEVEQIDSEIEELKEVIFHYASERGYQNIFGSDHKLTLKTKTKVKFPTKSESGRAELEELLKKEGKWTEVTDISLNILKKKVEKGTWDKALLQKLEPFEQVQEEKQITVKRIEKKS